MKSIYLYLKVLIVIFDYIIILLANNVNNEMILILKIIQAKGKVTSCDLIP